MAKRQQEFRSNPADIQTTPAVTTRARRPDANGICRGIDNSTWLWREIPVGSLRDTRDDREKVRLGGHIQAAVDNLAGLTRGRALNRQTQKGQYRQFKIMSFNVPTRYEAPKDLTTAPILDSYFGNQTVMKRACIMGVRLRATASVRNLGKFLLDGIDSVVGNAPIGGAPMSDFAADAELIDRALNRAGLIVPDLETLRFADSWWNYSLESYSSPNVAYVAHADHIHFLRDTQTRRALETASQRRGSDVDLRDCATWPKAAASGARQATVTFGAVQGFTFGSVDVTSPVAQWGMSLLSDHEALAVTIDGFAEPASTTKLELRTQARRFKASAQQHAANAKQTSVEAQNKQAELDDLVEMYSSDGAPSTIVDARIMVAFNGTEEDLRRVSPHGVNIDPMTNLQQAAWHEMMMCSNVEANPHRLDLPSTNVAYAGLGAIQRVGDSPVVIDRSSGVARSVGALLGFTEDDRQPVYISGSPQAEGDNLPIAIVSGATGSGKMVTILNKVPTPSGYILMGDLEAGDTVLGRDGKTCTVTYASPIVYAPAAYRARLSDGQVLLVDGDHQHVVSTRADRIAPRRRSRSAAHGRWSGRRALADGLRATADAYDGPERLDLDSLHALAGALPNAPWKKKAMLAAWLRFMDVEPRLEQRPAVREVAPVAKTDPVKLWPAGQVIRAQAERWANMPAKAEKAPAAVAVAERAGDAMLTLPQIERRMHAEGVPVSRSMLRVAAVGAGLRPEDGFTEVTIPATVREYRPQIATYRVVDALRALAERLDFLAAEEPSLDAAERIMTTAEMVAEGVRLESGHANFAIRVAEAIDLPEADLPVDPYAVGAWLGDGASAGGYLESMDSAIVAEIEAVGYPVTQVDELDGRRSSRHHLPSLWSAIIASGLWMPSETLRTPGALDKRIPMAYLRASKAQRLALLQGLMDTDGTISADGGCELSLSKRDLAEDALELVRSLGIKASMTSNAASYRDADGGLVPCQDRHRITFTTADPVFRLARKASRLPAEVRETSKWLYIESIEPVDSVPMRCIQVDSEDSTYLLEGFVPTHNTQVLLWLAYQWHEMGYDQIIVDPKRTSDHTPLVGGIGGNIAKISDMEGSDGPFDPIRVSPTISEGIALAADTIGRVDPFGGEGRKFETDIAHGLQYGVAKGELSSGGALARAAKDGMIDSSIVERIERFAATQPNFRLLYGRGNQEKSFSVSDGLTLVMVGDTEFEAPPLGMDPSQSTSALVRTSANLVRLIIRASTAALSGREAKIHLDEAWMIDKLAPDENAALGRLIRSMDIALFEYTQTPSGPLEARMNSYVGRGMLGFQKDADEARAGMKLLQMGDQPEVLERIITPRENPATGRPNMNSLQHLRSPSGAIRGAVFYVTDITGRMAPVEVTLPKDFLDLASTSPSDIRARKARGDLPEMLQLAERTNVMRRGFRQL